MKGNRSRFDRRSFLVATLLGCISAALFGGSWPGIGSRQRRAPGAGESELSRRDRGLATLGATLAAADPRRYRELSREAALELDRESPMAGARRRSQQARARLLDRARIQGDFEQGRVVVLDGWVLARSEVAAAAYLHALSIGC